MDPKLTSPTPHIRTRRKSRAPETPRLGSGVQRRAQLYLESPVGRWVKRPCAALTPGLLQVKREALYGSSRGKGIDFASAVPMAEQIARMQTGHPVGTGFKVSAQPWYAGYSNAASCYPAGPQALLRYGFEGVAHMPRGNLDTRQNEWVPPLKAQPPFGGSAAPMAQCTPHAWPMEATYPSGSLPDKFKQRRVPASARAWFARETTVPGGSATNVVHEFPETEVPRGLARALWSDKQTELAFELERESARQKKVAINLVRSRGGGILTEGLGPEAALAIVRRNQHQRTRAPMRRAPGTKARCMAGFTAIMAQPQDHGKFDGVSIVLKQREGNEKKQTAFKWRTVGQFHRKWVQHTKPSGSTGRPSAAAYSQLVEDLDRVASGNADQTRISRDQFVAVAAPQIHSTPLASRYFSVLASDPLGLVSEPPSSIQWARLVLPLAMACSAQAGLPPEHVLQVGLQLMESLAPPLTFSSVDQVLTMGCGTHAERLQLRNKMSFGFEFAVRAAAATAGIAVSVRQGMQEKPKEGEQQPAQTQTFTASMVIGLLVSDYPDLLEEVMRLILARFKLLVEHSAD
mmetsp:Transcript_16137/g.47370  ORF Transcript_16137/g.47370 Transcript_16137/m.47370 type:complete len:574 (-) Transcript_16137:153-1874(-)